MNKPIEDVLLSKRIEHERALVGCALVGEEEVRQSCGWLKPDNFNDTQMADFWRRFAAGEPANNIMGEQVGSQFYDQAYTWMGDTVSYFTAETHAREVARLAHVASISPRVAQLAKAVALGDSVLVQAIVQDLAEQTPATGHKVRTAYDVGDAFIAMLGEDTRVIPTNIPNLDAAIGGGLERQTLAIIASRPSMGKSALAFQIARNVTRSGCKTLFVSLEMSETNLWARAACGAAFVTWADVKGKNITAEQIERLKERTFDLMNLYMDRLLIEDQDATTERIWEMAASERPDVVVVDHLRLIGDGVDGDNENKRLGRITWRLKQMAKRLDCAVLLLAQLNRQPELRSGGNGQRPQLSDLRDSGEIEENADLVLMPYRDAYYHPEKEPGPRSRTEVWVRKARDGQLNVKVCLMFDLAAQWFEEPTPNDWPLSERG